MFAGKSVAYKLLPNQSQTLLALPESSIAIKAGFAAHNLWVTPHTDSERWPGGSYPVQNLHNDGITQWVKQVTHSSPFLLQNEDISSPGLYV